MGSHLCGTVEFVGSFRRGQAAAVPWCESCDRFFNPRSMPPDGTCPTCGRFIASPDDEPEQDEGPIRAPWHFYLLVIAVVVYLGWRLLQGVDWAARAVF